MIMHGFTLKAQNKDLDSMIKNEEVFDFVEQEAQFAGGEDSMIKFIVNNIKYPAEARHYNIQGKVTCSFTVKKDGEVDYFFFIISKIFSFSLVIFSWLFCENLNFEDNHKF